MIKELLISLYLLGYKLSYAVFRLFPVKENKTVFRVSFAENTLFLTNELAKSQPEQVIILYDKHLDSNLFKKNSETQLVANDFRKPLDFIKGIYHIATARNLFIDNYFAFLAALPKHNRPTIIQLWHANGAIKMFGLYDKSNINRSPKAIKRFNAVYNQFDFTITASDCMAEIFKQSFNLSDERILKLGLPRTDFFFNQQALIQSKDKFKHEFPEIKDKKVVLYAPTFRENNAKWDMQINFDSLIKSAGSDYLFFIKLHPSVNETQIDLPKSLINISDVKINEFLAVTDILITDYSSIPFEFALLSKPMIFHAPDLAAYEDERGLWVDYHELVPGPVTTNTDELINALQTINQYQHKVEEFKQDWNQYSLGISSQKIIEYFYD